MLVRHLALHFVLLRGVGRMDLDEPVRSGQADLMVRFHQPFDFVGLFVANRSA